MCSVTIFEAVYDRDVIKVGVGGFTPTAIQNVMLQRHSGKKVLLPYWEKKAFELPERELCTNFLRRAWYDYVAEMGDNYSRIENALKEEYNPVENYDRIEEWTDTNVGTSETNTTASTENSTVATTEKTDTTVLNGSDVISTTNANTGTESVNGTSEKTDIHTGTENNSVTNDNTNKVLSTSHSDKTDTTVLDGETTTTTDEDVTTSKTYDKTSTVTEKKKPLDVDASLVISNQTENADSGTDSETVVSDVATTSKEDSTTTLTSSDTVSGESTTTDNGSSESEKTVNLSDVSNATNSDVKTVDLTTTSNSTNTTENTSTENGTEESTINGTEDSTGNSKTDTDTTSHHTGRVHGNIGVAFATDGINREIQTRMYHFLESIVDDFISRVACF